MISDLLGSHNLIKTDVNEEYNSFRPMFQHFYNDSFSNTCIKIQTQDDDGNPVIKYYDLVQDKYIDVAAE